MNIMMSALLPAARWTAGLAIGLLLPLSFASAQSQFPKVGPNVNMVSGTRFPEGDPFLTKQNEPSIAVSSRNPRHLLAASNDYRQVAVQTAEGLKGGRAWNSLYKSVDGGTSWRSVVLGGCPLNIEACNDPTGLTAGLKALAPDFSADPTVRAGPHGTFFYSFIAGRRDGSTDGVVAVQRFVDKNNDIQRDTDVREIRLPGDAPGAPLKKVLFPAEDPILPDKLSLIDRGTSGQFIDKPWNAADVGGRAWNAGTCDLLSWTNQPDMDAIVGKSKETVPAFSVYVSYALFAGQGSNDHPSIYVAASNDCGNTFSKPVKVSNSLDATSGTSMAIDPLTGTVYVVWRRFGGLESPPKPDEIYMNKSADGGRTWLNQPVLVTGLVPYDQGATSASFRTLAFPSVAVSVKDGVSRVHVAYTSRKARPNATAPYACTAADPKDCDARVRIATSDNGGMSWTTKEVDPITASPGNPHGRGHQLQPALAFAAGKLAITWLDQRFDQTEEVLTCRPGKTCTQVTDLERQRVPMGNLDPDCRVDVSLEASPELHGLPQAAKDLLGPLPGACYEYRSGRPASVWTTYLTDATPGLVRRHTVDVFAALADPVDLVFSSAPVSQYLFGVSSRGTDTAIRQKEVFAPNLPLFVGGTAAFIGDYIDVAGQGIVATGPGTYKFNTGAGCAAGATPCFTTGGPGAVFHAAFTDNRDVVPPDDGDWTQPTCLATGFTTDPASPTTNFGACPETKTGFAGNRNQNVRAAIVVADSVAYAYSNSKKLSDATPRGFVITVENLGDALDGVCYRMKVREEAGVVPDRVTASFDRASFGTSPSPILPLVNLLVQPRSSATRSLWLKAKPATLPAVPLVNARVVVEVHRYIGADTPAVACDPASTAPASAFAVVGEVALNPDPGASDSLVGNGDGTDLAVSADTANNDMGGVVLANAVLANSVLSNNALDNGALSNKALTNGALSNVVLANKALSNLQIEELDPATNPQAAALALTNKALSNLVLTNRALSNLTLTNRVLSNIPEGEAIDEANALSNLALTNLDPANLALSNAVLSNNALTDVDQANTVLSNAVLTNAVISNVGLSNLALSNAALSNNALSNNPLEAKVLSNKALSNKVLSNSPLGDDLRTVEAANFDLSKNGFGGVDLTANPFADASFAVRNRGNTDTTLAVKLLLGEREQALLDSGVVKLQLVMRKVTPVPTAIPPTGPAVATGRALRIGLTQFNAQVSNVGTPEVISPDASGLGDFLPKKADAATLPLAPGERAFVTLRAIGPSGGAADPFEFLRWGAKFVVVDASGDTRTHIPLVIQSLSTVTMTALEATTFTLRTFGGYRGEPASATAIKGKLKWMTESESGSEIAASPIPGLPNTGEDFSFVAVCSPSTAGCPADPGNDRAVYSQAVTPQVSGTYQLLVEASDASIPGQKDQQLLRVVVNGASQTVTPPLQTLIPFGTIEFGKTVLLLQPSNTSSGALVVYSASGACTVTGPDPAGTYVLTPTQVSPPDCVVTASIAGNTVYAAITVVQAVTIGKGNQTIAFAPLPAKTYGDAPFALSATASSGLPVAFASATPAVCTVGGSTVTLVSAGICTITASQAGDTNYYPADPVVSQSFAVAVATQAIVFPTISAKTYGDPPFALSATAGSGLTVAFASTTPAVCTVSGNMVTLLAAGSCTITASQVGNANYGAAVPVTQTFTVAKAPQTISFGALVNRTFGEAPFALSATASSGLSVTFSSSTTAVCTVNGSTVTLLKGGTCTISADQAGNENFNPAPQVTQGFTVRVAAFTATAAMLQPRRDHTATLLVDGRVLVAGGFDSHNAPTDTTEVYCPAASAVCPASAVGKFTKAGNLPSKSAGHTATRLNDGRVLVAGGGNSSTEVFNPATGLWSQSGGMSSTRSYHTATLLADGRVLLAGGADNAGKSIQSTILFNPATGSFSAGPTMTTARDRHAAILLASGKVLIAGGRNGSGSLRTAEVCDASACTAVTGQMAQARYGHAIEMSPAIFVGPVVIGGADSAATVEAFTGDGFGTVNLPNGSPVTMRSARRDLTATLLPDNRLLVTGGLVPNGPVLQNSELFGGTFDDGPAMVSARTSHRATRLPDGRVLVTGGGLTATGGATSTAEVYGVVP